MIFRLLQNFIKNTRHIGQNVNEPPTKIEKREKKSINTSFKSNLQNQQIKKESNTNNTEDFDSTLANVDDRRLPWPGGIKQEFENLDIQENKFNEEMFKNKPIEVYKYFIEKVAELKFSFGEFLKDQEIIGRSPYLIYLYAFLILFIFGIGFGFLRKNQQSFIIILLKKLLK